MKGLAVILTTPSQRIARGLLATALAVTLPGIASAAPAEITIRNTGAAPVLFVYVSPDTSEVWERDFLGAATLAPGAATAIDLTSFGEHCVFDIRIEDAAGGAREYYAMDLCATAEVTYP